MSELRYDPIQGRWVIIATDRSRRPHDLIALSRQRQEVAFCPFCPGQEHRTPAEIMALGRPPGGAPNTAGWTVRVVPNRYPALSVEGDLDRRGLGLFDRMRGVGAHEVIIDSPEHAADLGSIPLEHLTLLVQVYQERVRDLYRDRRLKYALVFKNHGAVAGATLAHPHSQIIATPIIPHIVAQELRRAREHFATKERCLFCDVLNEELDRGERIVLENEHFVVFAPYASRFPFELMLIPRRHHHDLTSMETAERVAMATVLREIGGRLGSVLDDPPYNLVFHTAPNPDAFLSRPGHWATLPYDYHWHLEVLPRLTQVAGFETGTDFYINPTAPEEAARFLREGIQEEGM
jgi:UDPglucose--hexose-1-phosphate uridylyltransferase